MRVAVVAHAAKTLGGGLPELRRILEAEGIDPLWYEVRKAKRAPKQVRRALDEGAELVFAWGGDGTVRRCVGELAGEDACLAVIPAGTATCSPPTTASRRTSSARSRSACEVIAVASTSAASRASASRSWPASASTPR